MNAPIFWICMLLSLVASQDERDDPVTTDSNSNEEFDCDCGEQTEQLLCCDVGDEGMKVDYTNGCEAECDGIKLEDCVSGTCKSNHPCHCIPEFDPVCCNEFEYFVSLCDAECSGVSRDECAEGPCAVPDDDQEECSQCQNDENNGEDEDDDGVVCCDGNEYENSCFAECDGGYDYETQCSDGKCAVEYAGLFSLNTPQQYTIQNIIVLSIQLMIVSVCCIGLGCTLPTIFDYDPNRLSKGKKMSYGPV